jgi:hypothetical protein
MYKPDEYLEKISSKKTGLLFIALSLVFLTLAIWRYLASGLNTLTWVLLFFCGFFLFYVINFRSLLIHLTADSLRLKFGLFHWTIPANNIAGCELDDNLPWLMKNGGAGIHFMFVRKRYRASFNFLEYPRVVIELKEKAGLVRDVSFTTRYPEEVIQRIQATMTK